MHGEGTGIVIIAIDGPAGSGKSSTARAVAKQLGFRHLDTGALYRSLTLGLLRAGFAPGDFGGLDAATLDALRVRTEPSASGFKYFVGDDEVSDAIRSPEVNAHVSRIAALPAVRAWLLDRQRDAGAITDLVADGRDVGTVVFPDADLKVFLVARPEARAERRLKEQGIAAPTPAEVQAEVARLGIRDEIDSTREIAPLVKAEDAVEIDTSDIGFEDQVARIVELAQGILEQQGQGHGHGHG